MSIHLVTISKNLLESNFMCHFCLYLSARYLEIFSFSFVISLLPSFVMGLFFCQWSRQYEIYKIHQHNLIPVDSFSLAASISKFQRINSLKYPQSRSEIQNQMFIKLKELYAAIQRSQNCNVTNPLRYFRINSININIFSGNG